MNPRLKTSKKWTAFPGDFVDQIKEALLETFGPKLRGAELIIEGRIYQSEILLRLGFIEKNRLRQSNFEVSMDYKKEEAVDRIHDAIDAAASMMAEFIEDEESAELPLKWKQYDFEKLVVYCQYSTTNTKLELEADRLLGLTQEGIVKGSDEEDEDSFDPDQIRGSEDDDIPMPTRTDKKKLH